jgi:ABC-2 type transport system ATP-binding protein
VRQSGPTRLRHGIGLRRAAAPAALAGQRRWFTRGDLTTGNQSVEMPPDGCGGQSKVTGDRGCGDGPLLEDRFKHSGAGARLGAPVGDQLLGFHNTHVTYFGRHCNSEGRRLPCVSDSAIEISDLVKRYGERTAVDHLTFTALRGQVTALLGPNGAGKSTTLQVCEGLRRADGGRVRVLDLDPTTDGAQLLPRLGVMLQAGGIYPGANAREMLRLIASFADNPRNIDEMIELVGLAGAEKTTYRRLSGGERQRLSLAMALITRPELVLLDEPTAGMDPQARRATWDLVGQLRRDGVSVLLTTHFMDEAETLADHVVVIDHGKVVAAGSPAELTASGQGHLTFRCEPNLPLGDLSSLVDGWHAEELEPGNYRIVGDVEAEHVAAVSAYLAARGQRPTDLTVGRASLEDVFLDLTGREMR